MIIVLELFHHISFGGMLIGMLICLWVGFRESPSKVFFMLGIPFYVVHYIFRMPDTWLKKLLGILVMGSFVVYVFASLFLLLFNPTVA